jgi:hypothetical protein
VRCCEIVNGLDPVRHELEIWRSGEAVWTGPILNVNDQHDEGTVEIRALDLSAYFQWRIFLHTMKPRGIDLADIFAGYVNYALDKVLPPWGLFQEGDPALVGDNPGIEMIVLPTGVTGDRTVYHHDLKVVGSELEELARTGIDWTMLNRTLLCGGLEITAEGGSPYYLRQPLRDEFFIVPPRVRRTADGMVTYAWMRANGVRASVGGPDPSDGLLLERVLDEYSIEDQTSAEAAVQGYYDRAHEPSVYVEGGDRLAPSCPIEMNELVPGARVQVDLREGCLPYHGLLRLEDVSGTWTAEGEDVRIVLQPLGGTFDARGEG